MKPFLIKRLSQPAVKLPIKHNIKYFLNQQDLIEIENLRNLRLDISNTLPNTVKCSICRFFYSQAKSTRQECLQCHTAICIFHKAKICENCALSRITNKLR